MKELAIICGLILAGLSVLPLCEDVREIAEWSQLSDAEYMLRFSERRYDDSTAPGMFHSMTPTSFSRDVER